MMFDATLGGLVLSGLREIGKFNILKSYMQRERTFECCFCSTDRRGSDEINQEFEGKRDRKENSVACEGLE